MASFSLAISPMRAEMARRRGALCLFLFFYFGRRLLTLPLQQEHIGGAFGLSRLCGQQKFQFISCCLNPLGFFFQFVALGLQFGDCPG
jgi:hypothetical protein